MDIIEILKEYQKNYFKLYEQEYKRYLFHEINFNSKLIGIVGARGVGKTTILLQYLKENSLPITKKLYFSADNIDIDSIFDIAYKFSKSGGKLLIIDEIHKYRGFEKDLKKIHDMLDLQVIFSGSSALKIDNSIGDLSRRAVIYELKGLSFREFIELKEEISLSSFSLDEVLHHHEEIAFDLTTKIKPFEHFKEYLMQGYYPFYFEEQDTYLYRLKSTINTVVEIDLPSIFPIEYEKIINLKKLITLVCQSKPFKLNIKELANKIGISDYQTLYKYIEYLKRGTILRPVRASTKGDNIFSKPDKLYLANTNLYFAYCKNSEIGTIRETFFASMLENIATSKKGDFLVDEKYTFEIGGKNKSFKQIKELPNSYVVADDIEIGSANKIALWLFGFLY